MSRHKQINRRHIITLVALFTGFIIAFQMYVATEKKSYRHVGDLITPTIAAITGSKEDKEDEVYVSDQQELFDELIKGLDQATFKPTKLTATNPLYKIHLFSDSLHMTTTIIVRENDQIEVNDELYNVDNASLEKFEKTFFSEEYEAVLRNFSEFSMYMYDKVAGESVFPNQEGNWEEVVALSWVAAQKEVDLSTMELLSIAPTKEVAEQLIANGITGPMDESAVIEAVREERIEVVNVLLENDIGLSNNSVDERDVSPVVVAKMNEDADMVDLLLEYGFEDVEVGSKQIEAVRQSVDFANGEPEKIVAQIKKGKLPGTDIRLPTSTKEIIETWGDERTSEDPTILNYNKHYFYSMVDIDDAKEGQESNEIWMYTYVFNADERMSQEQVDDIFGEPDFVDAYGDVRERRYRMGAYELIFSVDLDEEVWNVHYVFGSE